MKFPGEVRTKLHKTGTTIFTVMSALAAEHKAINLSQGFPDFKVAPDLIALIAKNFKAGHNQYAPMAGVPGLREQIASKMKSLYSANYDPETEVTVTAGGTQAIYSAISAIIREGDEVIVFEPAYDCYVPAIELNGGIPVHIQLKTPDYHIDWNEVKKMVNQRTRMIIINTPHNPTGAVLSARDMAQLEKLTVNTDIVIVSDEVYEHVVFDGYEHQSIARFPKLAERSFIIFSFGKTYHATGWKVGYCVAPSNLTAAFRKVHQYMVFAVNTPIQHALASYMEDPAHYSGIGEMYQHKRDYFVSHLKKSGFKLLPCSGSYFQLADYSAISHEKDTDFAVRLTRDFGVAAIPISVFYKNNIDNKILRFCFAKEEATLKAAAAHLCNVK
ncbi:MAG TPA: methionine aminotransferase [Bacteroidia bacterium]|nr:methionine aminotransferase [Bacteroidia bacterium]